MRLFKCMYLTLKFSYNYVTVVSKLLRVAMKDLNSSYNHYVFIKFLVH